LNEIQFPQFSLLRGIIFNRKSHRIIILFFLRHEFIKGNGKKKM
jgi:hypothetical protein